MQILNFLLNSEILLFKNKTNSLVRTGKIKKKDEALYFEFGESIFYKGDEEKLFNKILDEIRNFKIEFKKKIQN